jgi:colicin import membrane protein
MSADGALIPIESINAVEVFTGQNLDDLLARIRAEVAPIVPDLTTASSRKEIASLAYKVARSKTAIDDAGKTLVADWKSKAAEVDASRKKARDYLDALRDEVRKPLDDWEADQARIEQEAIQAAQREREAAEAAARADLERRDADIRAREAVIAAKEKEIADKAAAEQAAIAQAARDEAIRQQAEARAKQEAADAIANAEAAAAAAKQAAIDAAEQAARDQAEAVRQAEERAAQAAARVKQEQIDEAARIRAEDDKRQANIAHRRKVNVAAMNVLVAHGIESATAKKIIELIVTGTVPAVSIHY